MLVSHPVPQISSASSSSHTPCDCPKSPLINGSWTRNVSRDRKVNSLELGQVKVRTERNLAAYTAGTLGQVTHQEEPRSTLSLDACWGRRSVQNVSKATATPGVLLSNCSLAVQSMKTHTLGQRGGKEHVFSSCGIRRSAKIKTSKMLVTYRDGWEMPVQLHFIAQTGVCNVLVITNSVVKNVSHYPYLMRKLRDNISAVITWHVRCRHCFTFGAIKVLSWHKVLTGNQVSSSHSLVPCYTIFEQTSEPFWAAIWLFLIYDIWLTIYPTRDIYC